MATLGSTTTRYADRLAGNLLRRARAEKGLTQRTLAAAAGVPQSTVARIESGAQQPSLPLLVRILAGVDLEPRIALEPCDAHDDVLDATEARLSPLEQEARTQEQDEFLDAVEMTHPARAPLVRRESGGSGSRPEKPLQQPQRSP